MSAGGSGFGPERHDYVFEGTLVVFGLFLPTVEGRTDVEPGVVSVSPSRLKYWLITRCTSHDHRLHGDRRKVSVQSLLRKDF